MIPSNQHHCPQHRSRLLRVLEIYFKLKICEGDKMPIEQFHFGSNKSGKWCLWQAWIALGKFSNIAQRLSWQKENIGNIAHYHTLHSVHHTPTHCIRDFQVMLRNGRMCEPFLDQEEKL